MHFFYCQLPLLRIQPLATKASNDEPLNTTLDFVTQAITATSNVRLMRRGKDQGSTRFALSGKLADVCAALDQLAAQETRNARLCAFQ